MTSENTDVIKVVRLTEDKEQNAPIYGRKTFPSTDGNTLSTINVQTKLY